MAFESNGEKLLRTVQENVDKLVNDFAQVIAELTVKHNEEIERLQAENGRIKHLYEQQLRRNSHASVGAIDKSRWALAIFDGVGYAIDKTGKEHHAIPVGLEWDTYVDNLNTEATQADDATAEAVDS